MFKCYKCGEKWSLESITAGFKNGISESEKKTLAGIVEDKFEKIAEEAGIVAFWYPIDMEVIYSDEEVQDTRIFEKWRDEACFFVKKNFSFLISI